MNESNLQVHVPNNSATGNPSFSGQQSLTAQDSDHLERHWIVAVEDIVRNTANDPYVRAQELMKLKAQYVERRYGKNIKTS